MDEKFEFAAIAATTHVDRHGDQITKEALHQAADDFLRSEELMWMNWDHQTTLPPIGLVTTARVEPREDGEYQLVLEGLLLGREHYVLLPQSDIKGLDVTWAQVDAILGAIEPSSDGYLEISYDWANFAPEDAADIIRSIGTVVPVEERHRLRKSVVPHPVIWVLVAFAGGFIARFGEVAADKFLETAKAFYKELTERFARFLTLQPGVRPDVVFSIPIPESATKVEGAVEEADKVLLEYAWSTLPTLYALAAHFIGQNPPDFFHEMKFLFNPVTKEWEINFFTTRRTHQIIQGPRYYDPAHPLRRRYERELERMTSENVDRTVSPAADVTEQ